MPHATSQMYSQVVESSHSCEEVCVLYVLSADYFRVSTCEVFVNILEIAELLNIGRYIFENFF